MIKAVFFDFYKTLCVWGQPLEASLQKIAERYQFEIDWERYATARENLYADASDSDPTEHSLFETMQEIVESYYEFVRGLGVQEHVGQITWELLQSEHSLFAATNATLYDDVVPTLEHLRDTGFKLAIVSNWDTPLDPLTERLGIAHYFDTIVASHDARVRSAKPDPYIFNYTLAAVGISAAEAVHVGDTYEADIVGARNAGIRPILIDRDKTQTDKWRETIQSLSELSGLLSAGT
ncbi:MAG: HAD-IA family hydrolase [Candidatus Poribacteria bacterium]|nr:HAD-IA family hydrolase [Candidatus Poribacteria bacterium]